MSDREFFMKIDQWYLQDKLDDELFVNLEKFLMYYT
jgi:hypothetical protein